MFRRIAIVVAALACTGLGATAALAAPPAPTNDPFYSYSGNLADLAPGTVLRTRMVQISAGGSPAAYPATQVLYRTQNQLRQPSATVATIIRPAAPTPVKLLSYQTFYDGVASTCRPSYTLQGGDPSNTTANVDEALMLSYVTQGFTVVTSDYEGPTDDYGAGRESAYGTLDAIRAAEHQLALQPSAPVGLLGYSGGSIASEWASEVAPAYAPALHLIGVAEGGIPVDYTHTLDYIDGSSDWAGAIPAVSLGLARAYHLDFAQYLSPEGAQIVQQVSQGCLNPTAYPGLHFADMLKPQYKNWKSVPAFVHIFNDHIMGTAGTPKEPLLMGVGNADGTGDGVMIAKDVQELAHEYCQRGVPVEFHVYSGSNHDEAAPQFEAQAQSFLDQLYSGQTPANGCSSIGPGNPLTPLPPPQQTSSSHSSPTRARVRVHWVALNRHAHGVVVAISAVRGTVRHLTVEVKRHGRVLAKVRLARLGTHTRRVLLKINRHVALAGRDTVIILIGHTTAVRRVVRLPHRRG